MWAYLGGGLCFPLLLTYVTQYNSRASPPHTRQCAHLYFFQHIDPKTQIDKGSHNILQYSWRQIIIMPPVISVKTHTSELIYTAIKCWLYQMSSGGFWTRWTVHVSQTQGNKIQSDVFLHRSYVIHYSLELYAVRWKQNTRQSWADDDDDNNVDLLIKTEGFITAIQDQVILTRKYKKYILKQPDTEELRRRCGKESETIQHITAACEQLAPTEYV